LGEEEEGQTGGRLWGKGGKLEEGKGARTNKKRVQGYFPVAKFWKRREQSRERTTQFWPSPPRLHGRIAEGAKGEGPE